MSVLDPLRRILGREAGGPPRAASRAIAQWARDRGLVERRVHGGAGLVVDGPADAAGGSAWRLEWGPPQRPYIQRAELRLLAAPPLPKRLQMLCGSLPLLESAERAAYEDCVGSTRTRVDSDIPPEMRWLIVHPRLGAAELGELRARYLAAASDLAWLRAWLTPRLRAALLAPPADAPLIVTIARGRLTLRTAFARPQPAEAIDAWIELIEAGVGGAGWALRAVGTSADELSAPAPAAAAASAPASEFDEA